MNTLRWYFLRHGEAEALIPHGLVRPQPANPPPPAPQGAEASRGPAYGMEGEFPILECCCLSPRLGSRVQPPGWDPPAPLAAFALVQGWHRGGTRQGHALESLCWERSRISLLKRSGKPSWCFRKELRGERNDTAVKSSGLRSQFPSQL